MEYKHRIIIAGGREFNNFVLLTQRVRFILSSMDHGDIEIVSGGARGADRLGEIIAEKERWALKKFPAEWNKYGTAAGPIRNTQMAQYSTHLICFWDGQTPGSADMIKKAKEYNLHTRIIYYDN